METKPMTNADRIRAMTDEELADKIGDSISCINCPAERLCVEEEMPCTGMLLAWLRSPVESEGDHFREVTKMV